MHIRPVDMPTLRSETYEAVRRHGVIYYEGELKTGRQSRPAGPDLEAAKTLTQEEAERLNSADLYFVSDDMARLAVAAADSLPGFNLLPEDMPSGWGLAYFDTPIAEPITLGERGDATTPIVAAAWGPSPSWTPRGKRGIWVTWYADRDAVLAQFEGRARGSAMAQLRQTTSRLLTVGDFQVIFGSEQLQVLKDGKPIPYSAATHNAKWFGILKVTWLLMAQPLAKVHDAEFDRAARRRAQRQHANPPKVRVISLRRETSSGGGDSDREYHHQWIVRGHWRQQWYPSREVHRPVWIAPHIKGPEGAPLIGGEKVYAWTR